MEKCITGTIEYKIVIKEEGDWVVTYGSDKDSELDVLHQDLASLIIAQRIMGVCEARLRDEKNSSEKGSDKKFYASKIEKAISGRFGVKVTTDYLLSIYDEYVAYLEKQKHEEDKSK